MSPIGKFFGGKKWAAWATGIVVIGILTVIWLRTGIYPAASSGDDVWLSEAGYYLLHEGVLRRPWMADDMGGAIRDFFPPVAAIIQAGSFAIFGVNSFGEMAQSSLACTLLTLLVIMLARRHGASSLVALAAGIAIFGLQNVLNQAIRPRHEPWLAAFLLLSLLLRESAKTPSRRGQLLALLAGLSLGISCLSYFPIAPSALLAGLLPLPLKRAEWPRYFLLLLGGAIMLVLFLVFINPDWDLFRRQMFGMGSFYFSWHMLLNPFLNLLNVSDPIFWLMSVEAMGLVIVSAFIAIASSSKGARWHALRAIIMSLPYFLHGGPANLVAAGVLFVVALAASTNVFPHPSILRNVCAIVIALAAILGTIKIGLIATVAWLQREGRNYASVRAQIDQLVTEPGRVASVQQAWLALRPRLGPDQLHWLASSGSPQSFILRSMILREQDAGAKFKYVILDKGRIQSIVHDYPWLGTDIAAGKFREIGQVHLPFRSLPFARNPPYDMVIYKRQE